MKLSVLDVSAKLSDGTTVDIEIQIVNRHDFRKRAPYNWAMRHVKKLSAGMTFIQIKPTITICLLAFDLLEEEESYRNSFRIRNDDSGKLLCDDLQIIYLELPKFRRYIGKTAEPRTGLERWLLYFTNEEGERMERVAADDPAIFLAKTLEKGYFANETESELYFQTQKRLITEMSDQLTYGILLEEAKQKAMNEGRAEGMAEGKTAGMAEGMAEGMAKGMAKGKVEGKAETAINLLKMGVGVEIIAQATGFSIDEIHALAD
jgi:predicted transposase/invertase (TIGR01784 family)